MWKRFDPFDTSPIGLVSPMLSFITKLGFSEGNPVSPVTLVVSLPIFAYVDF